MRTQYKQLTADDRNRIQRGRNEGLSQGGVQWAASALKGGRSVDRASSCVTAKITRPVALRKITAYGKV